MALSFGASFDEKSTFYGYFENESSILINRYDVFMDTKERLFSIGLRYQTPFKVIAPYFITGINKGKISYRKSNFLKKVLNTSSNVIQTEEANDILLFSENQLTGGYVGIGTTFGLIKRIKPFVEFRSNSLTGKGEAQNDRELGVKFSGMQFYFGLRLFEI